MNETDDRTEIAGPAAHRPGKAPSAASGRDGGAPRLRGRGHPLALRLVGILTGALLRMVGATWRLETIGRDPRRPGGAGPAQLAALFHESMVPCAWLYRDQAYSVAVSRSRDGDLIRAVLLALGYDEPARGSSSRGASTVLRGLVRRLARGTTVAVLVDGPRGPARTAKSGAIHIARLSGRPVQPVAFAARPALRLSSWDKSLIPLPFARVVVAYGEPMDVPNVPEIDDAEAQRRAQQLDQTLIGLHQAADERLRGPRMLT